MSDAPVTTPNIGLIKPDVLGSEDVWGDELNQNADTLDTVIGELQTADTGFLKLSGGAMTGALTLAADPAAAAQAATKGYVDAGDATLQGNVNAKVAKAGDSMTGLLTLSADPTVALHAATKQYADARQAAAQAFTSAGFLSLAGGTLSGPLTLPGDPTQPLQATTKHYVDTEISSVAGIVEAPLDNAIYGRINASWATVLATVGGTLTGTVNLNSPALPAGAVPCLNVREAVLPTDGHLSFNAWNNGSTWTYKGNGGAAVIFFDLGSNRLTCMVAPPGTANQAFSFTAAWQVDQLGNFVSNQSVMAAKPAGDAFVGSWQMGGTTPSNVGFWNYNNTLWFGNADGNGVVQGARASLDSGGNLTLNGNISVGSGLFLATGQVGDWVVSRSAPWRVFAWRSDGWSDAWNEQTGQRIWNAPGVTLMSLDGAGGLTLSGTITAPALSGSSITGGWVGSNGNMWVAGQLDAGGAINAGGGGLSSATNIQAGQDVIANREGYKPGGGPWAASSDARLKRDLSDYRAGLDAVCALRPKSYRYNGRGGTVDDGQTYYGLTAQEAREVMPELVFPMPAGFAMRLHDAEDDDDDPIDDALGVNAGPLTFALVNCVRELRELTTAQTEQIAALTARVAALEGASP